MIADLHEKPLAHGSLTSLGLDGLGWAWMGLDGLGWAWAGTDSAPPHRQVVAFFRHRTASAAKLLKLPIALASRRIADKNTELGELNREKNRFLLMAVHDLRNLLGTAMLFGELLAEQQVGPMNAQQEEMVSAICKSSRFMLELHGIGGKSGGILLNSAASSCYRSPLRSWRSIPTLSAAV